jgi:tetratricopeptide (TPR) repeat protein
MRYKVEATQSFRRSFERQSQKTAKLVNRWIYNLAVGGHGRKKLVGPDSEALFEEGVGGSDLRLVFSYYRRGDEGPVLRLIALGGHDHVFRVSKRIQNTTFAEFPVRAPLEPRPVGQEAPFRKISENVFDFHLQEGEVGIFVLQLTHDQYDLVLEPGTLFFDGAAGSGKTTVLAYRAYHQIRDDQGARGLVVTLEPQLALYTHEIIKKIADLEGQEPLERIEVLDFGSLLQRFEARWWDRDLPPGCVNRAVVRAEYRGGIAGRWLADSPPPTREAFQAGFRGERLHALLTFEERGALFDLLSNWAFGPEVPDLAPRIEQRRDWDRMGAARWCSRRLIDGESIPGGGWTHLFVDEAQDFTDVELDLLGRLVPDPRRWTIAGDERQVVHPSLFTWERVQDMMHRAQARRTDWEVVAIPGRRTMDINFRNPRPIMALADSLFEAGQRRLGEALPLPTQTAVLDSDVLPCRVAVPPSGRDRMESALARLSAKVAYLAIISADQKAAAATCERVRQYNDSFAKSYCPATSKGIEFDVVVAVDALDGALDRSSAPGAFLHALNKAYVLCTRSRQRLYLLETGEPRAFLDQPVVAHTLRRLTFEAWLTEMDREIERDTADQFADAAADAEKRGELEAAYQNWRDGGHHGEAARVAEGLAEKTPAEKHRWWARAADAWESAGRLDKANPLRAQLAEASAQWVEASRFWREVGEGARADLCWAHHLAGVGRRREAAETYERLNEHDKAIEQYLEVPNALDKCLEVGRRAGRTGLWEVEICTRSGQHQRAAEEAERLAQDHPNERERLRRAGFEAWVAAGQPERAVRVGRMLAWQSRRIAEVLSDLGAHRAAADLLLAELPNTKKLSNTERVALYLDTATYLSRAGDLTRCRELAERCDKQGGLRAAADIFRLVGDEAAASATLVRAGEQARRKSKWALARQCFLGAGRPDLAAGLATHTTSLKDQAKAAETAGLMDEAITLFERARLPGDARRLYTDAAKAAEKEGRLEVALRHYKSDKDDDGEHRVQGRLFHRQANEAMAAGRVDDAILLMEQAAKSYSQAAEDRLAWQARMEMRRLDLVRQARAAEAEGEVEKAILFLERADEAEAAKRLREGASKAGL